MCPDPFLHLDPAEWCMMQYMMEKGLCLTGLHITRTERLSVLHRSVIQNSCNSTLNLSHHPSCTILKLVTVYRGVQIHPQVQYITYRYRKTVYKASVLQYVFITVAQTSLVRYESKRIIVVRHHAWLDPLPFLNLQSDPETGPFEAAPLLQLVLLI